MFGQKEIELHNKEINHLHEVLGQLDKHSLAGQVFEGTERFARKVIENGGGFGLMTTIQRLQDDVDGLKQKLRVAEQQEEASKEGLRQSRENNTLAKALK